MNTAESRDRRAAQKQLNATIAYATSVAVSCALLIWSAFNTTSNVLSFFRNEEANQAWWITAIMVLITCVVPFCLALWLLFHTLAKYKPVR